MIYNQYLYGLTIAMMPAKIVKTRSKNMPNETLSAWMYSIGAFLSLSSAILKQSLYRNCVLICEKMAIFRTRIKRVCIILDILFIRKMELFFNRISRIV